MVICKDTVIGIGSEGKEVISILINKYKFTNVKYVHFEEDENLFEFYNPFEGEIEYLYGKKNVIYEIGNINKNKWIDFFKQFDQSSIIVLCLAEPISQTLLEFVYKSDITLFIRIPFKFENSHNFQSTLSWVKCLEKRKNTILLNSDKYSLLGKPVNLPILYNKMIYGLSAFMARALKLFSNEIETSLLPLNSLCKKRMFLIFDPADFSFSKEDILMKIDYYLDQIKLGLLHRILIKVNEESPYSYFVKKESVIDLLSILLILYLFKNKFGFGDIHIWGIDAYTLTEILDQNINFSQDQSNLKEISEAFEYLLKDIKYGNNYIYLEQNLDQLLKEYNLEFWKYHIKYDIVSALTIIN